MNNKKIITVVGSLALIILIVFLVFSFFKKDELLNYNQDEPEEIIFQPEFLNEEEKQVLGIPLENKIQVLGRDDNNEISVYRVIRNDEDIIDPREIGPLSPQIEKNVNY